MKVILYARKSTDDKTHQVLSIDTQLFELRRLALHHGLTIVDEIQEERTARTAGRPAFNNMLKRLMKGEATGLLCWKLHRLARNFDDGGKIITLLQTGTLKGIYTLDKLYTPQDNVLLLAIEFGIATQFSKDLSNDVRLGLKTKFRNGGWPSLAPVGYLNDKANNTVMLHPQHSELVKQAFLLIAEGRFTTADILRRMNSAGLVTNRKRKPLTRSNFHNLLKNPFYYGLMRYKGEFEQGKHEPIITKEIFDRVQEILSGRHRARSAQLKTFRYRGVFKCGNCGCLVTSENQKTYVYLHCTKRVTQCAERYFREEKVDLLVTRFLSELKVPRSLPDTLREEVEALETEARDEQKKSVSEWKEKDSAIQQSLDKLLSLFLAGGLTEDEYKTGKNDLVVERHRLREALNNGEHCKKRFELVYLLIKELNEAIDVETNDNMDRKRDFIKMIGSNLLLSSGSLTVELKKRWKTYVDWKQKLGGAWEDFPTGYQRAMMRSLVYQVRNN